MQDEEKKNAEVVARFYQAISRGDLATARGVLDREIEWTESNRTGWWFREALHGPCALFNELILPVYGWLADFRVELDQSLPAGESVVAVGRLCGFNKTTDKEFRALTVQVWTLRQGKAVRVQAYTAPLDGMSEAPGKTEAERAAA